MFCLSCDIYQSCVLNFSNNGFFQIQSWFSLIGFKISLTGNFSNPNGFFNLMIDSNTTFQVL